MPGSITKATSSHTIEKDKVLSSQRVAGTPLNLDAFLVELADTINATLDLDTLLGRVAEAIRRGIHYEIFAILLLNERTQDLRMRFQIGHAPEVEKIRIKVGQGLTGRAAQRREPVLVNDVTQDPDYINAHPSVRSELAVPMIAKNKVIGVIDMQAAQVGYFTEEHRRLMTVVASRIAVAIENARLYTRVYRQAQTLEVLNEISREFTSILNVDQLLRRIGELLSRLIDFQMFSILLLDPSMKKLQHRFSLRFNEDVHLKHDILLGRGLVGAAAQSGKAILVADVTKDPRYILLNPETRSELCVPLIYKERVIGVLDLEHTRRGYFTEDHVRTITTLAGQLAIAIENAQLYERIAKEEQRMERDLAMAREVQMHMLPPCCPILNSAEMSAKFLPAHTIGGDMYDFIAYSGGRTGIAVGDVSGKGAPAALYAAMVGGILRSVANLEPSPSETLTAINATLGERKIESQFVSMLFAVWDDERHLMQIANSGQPQPIYCHNGVTQELESTGLPLGLFEDADYDEITIQAHPGDVFVFFSDGMSDAEDSAGEQYGRARLEQLVAKNHTMSADDLVSVIFDEVALYSSGVQAFDDETVVVVKVRAGKNPDEVEQARKTRRKTSSALRKVS